MRLNGIDLARAVFVIEVGLCWKKFVRHSVEIDNRFSLVEYTILAYKFVVEMTGWFIGNHSSWCGVSAHPGSSVLKQSALRQDI